MCFLKQRTYGVIIKREQVKQDGWLHLDIKGGLPGVGNDPCKVLRSRLILWYRYWSWLDTGSH